MTLENNVNLKTCIEAGTINGDNELKRLIPLKRELRILRNQILKERKNITGVIALPKYPAKAEHHLLNLSLFEVNSILIFFFQRITRMLHHVSRTTETIRSARY